MKRTRTSITRRALEATWTFERQGDRLTVRREHGGEHDSYRLVLNGAQGAKTFSFTDLPALITFQQDMETFLVRTGWSLAAFSPDQRTGRDRRGWPRTEPDRRRWWTDVWPR